MLIKQCLGVQPSGPPATRPKVHPLDAGLDARARLLPISGLGVPVKLLCPGLVACTLGPSNTGPAPFSASILSPGIANPGIVSARVFSARAPGPDTRSSDIPVRRHVRVYRVSLRCMPGDVIPKRPGIAGLLLGFLLQPRGINLRLLSLGAGTARPGFLFARIEFNILGFAAHFGGLFPMRFIPLLLHGPTPIPRYQHQHDQDHHHDANNHPNPRCCVQRCPPLSTSL